MDVVVLFFVFFEDCDFFLKIRKSSHIISVGNGVEFRPKIVNIQARKFA